MGLYGVYFEYQLILEFLCKVIDGSNALSI